jgi:hypothetical protein
LRGQESASYPIKEKSFPAVIFPQFVEIYVRRVSAISGETPQSLIPYGSRTFWKVSAESVNLKGFALVAGRGPLRKRAIFSPRNPIACMSQKFPI